jgi:photosystem II stability/assembly factor-like uncharacterized protein
MTEVPKIVHDRLRAAALDGVGNATEPMHADANLLAAFTEQSLAASERDGVLEHLALCGYCRDTVALALPAENVGALPIAAESEAAPISHVAKPLPHKIFAWPSLRWAALAAGVAVVGSVLLLRPGKLNQSPASSQIASNAAPAVANVGAASSGASPIATPSVNSEEADLVSEAPLSKDASPRKFTARRALTAAPPPPAESGMLLARNKKSSQPADNLANMPSAMAMDDSMHLETTNQATQTTEASAAASEPSLASRDAALVARNNDAPAIEKAKPALQGTAQLNGLAAGGGGQLAAGAPTAAAIQGRATMSGAKLAVGANATSAAGFAQYDFARRNFAWTISAGVLQRSLDGGQTWQDNLHAERSLLCYASQNGEIWAGGQGGALYHSMDGGLTWVQVHPTAESRQLLADISRIELRNSNNGNNNSGSGDTPAPSEIVVSTSNKESWTSADGGKNWKIK